MEKSVDKNLMTLAMHLSNLIKRLIVEEKYGCIPLLIESANNVKKLPLIAKDLLDDVCLKYLNDETLEEKPGLYNCASGLLNVIASKVPSDDLLIKLLELIEEEQSCAVYQSALCALQNMLLKLGDTNCKALEWALDSIACSLSSKVDARQLSILTLHQAVESFYAPLLFDIKTNSELSQNVQTFRDCSRSSRETLLSCFFIRLLSNIFPLNDFPDDYNSQLAQSLIGNVAALHSDPYFLLNFVESRMRWIRRMNFRKGVCERSSNNIFTIEEICPALGLGTFYYLLLVEKSASLEKAPKVYTALYLYESLSYLAVELIRQGHPGLQMWGLRLLKYAIENLGDSRIPYTSLHTGLPRNVCISASDIISFSPSLGRFARHVMSKYISQFDDRGRFRIIWYMTRLTPDQDVYEFLITLYLRFVEEALKITPLTYDLPPEYCGLKFRLLMMRTIRTLTIGRGNQTMRNNMKKIAYLDRNRRTGIMDIVDIIRRNFMILAIQRN